MTSARFLSLLYQNLVLTDLNIKNLITDTYNPLTFPILILPLHPQVRERRTSKRFNEIFLRLPSHPFQPLHSTNVVPKCGVPVIWVGL